MSIIRDIKNSKIKYADSVIFVKNGNFYRCYDKDAYIVSYLMNYQIKQATSATYMCGFPVGSLEKVEDVLETNQVSYRILDFKKEDKTLVEECNFNEHNLYEDIYSKAYKYINLKKRIELMCYCLTNNIEKEGAMDKIAEIEKLVFESFS